MNQHTYGLLTYDKGAKTIPCKKDSFLTNGVGSTGGQHVEKCKSTHSYLPVKSKSPSCTFSHKGLSHKTRYTETYRGSGEEHGTHVHRIKFPEQNTHGLCSKIKNRQMGPHKIECFCK